MQNELRKKVKMLKVLQGVNYNEIAGLLEIKKNSLYNWLSGYYDFGEKTTKRLTELIDLLSEV